MGFSSSIERLRGSKCQSALPTGSKRQSALLTGSKRQSALLTGGFDFCVNCGDFWAKTWFCPL